MGLYLQGTYKSESDETWVVELHDSDYSGAVVTHNDIDAPGVVFHVNGSSGDRNTPLLTTRATITFLAKTEIKEFRFDRFIDAEEGRFFMKVFRDSVLEFVGRMLVDVAVRGDTNWPLGIEVTATDGLGALKGIEYAPDFSGGNKKLTDLLIQLLDYTGVQDFFGANDTYLTTSVYWFESFHDESTDDPFAETYVKKAAFLKSQTKNDGYLSVYDCIKAVVQSWHCRLYFSAGSWRLESINHLKDLRKEFEYNKTGGLENTNTNIRHTKQVNQPGAIKLAGGTISYLPGTHMVSVKYNHDTLSSVLRPSNTITQATGSIDMGYIDIETDVDKLIFRSSMSFDGDPFATPPGIPGDVWRYTFAFTIKIGSYYLKRVAEDVGSIWAPGAAEWTTTPSTFIYDVGPYVQIQAGSALIEFETPVFPGPPADGTFEIDIEGIYMIDETNTPIAFPGGFTYSLYSPVLEVIGKDNSANFNSTNFRITNEWIKTNTYTFSIETRFGTGPQWSSPGRLITDAFNNVGTWNKKGETDTFVFSRLLAEEIMLGQLTTRKRIDATIFGPMQPRQVLLYGGFYYALVNGSFNTRNSETSGTWIEITAPGTSPTPPIELPEVLEVTPITAGLPSQTGKITQGGGSVLQVSQVVETTQLGDGAGDFADPDGVNVGKNAGKHNKGVNNTSVGKGAGLIAYGDCNTAVGKDAFSAFDTIPATAKNFAPGDVTTSTREITVTSHGFGSIGEQVNLLFTTTGTAPTMMANNVPYSFLVIDANTLELLIVEGDYTFASGGTGTHTLTGFEVINNSTAVGCGAMPTKSNQIQLGNDSVTELRVGTVVINVSPGSTVIVSGGVYNSDGAAIADGLSYGDYYTAGLLHPVVPPGCVVQLIA